MPVIARRNIKVHVFVRTEEMPETRVKLVDDRGGGDLTSIFGRSNVSPIRDSPRISDFTLHPRPRPGRLSFDTRSRGCDDNRPYRTYSRVYRPTGLGKLPITPLVSRPCTPISQELCPSTAADMAPCRPRTRGYPPTRELRELPLHDFHPLLPAQSHRSSPKSHPQRGRYAAEEVTCTQSASRVSFVVYTA